MLKPQSTASFGRRLLPNVVDEFARSDPDRIFGSYLKSSDTEDGFSFLSMAQQAQAVNHTAWWIKNQVGLSSTFETIAYMGASDFRYPIFILAGIKFRCKVNAYELEKILADSYRFFCQALATLTSKSTGFRKELLTGSWFTQQKRGI
jgi:hypothetical protein